MKDPVHVTFNRTLFYALFFMTFSFSDREREEERGGAAMRSLEDREVSAMFHRDTLLARIVRWSKQKRDVFSYNFILIQALRESDDCGDIDLKAKY